MREALQREGAPADLLQCLTKLNIPMSQALMASADLIVATGGQPMVRAAYSSGTPAYGVGAGNSTMIIDETANIEEAARNTRLSQDLGLRLGLLGRRQPGHRGDHLRQLLAQLQKEGGHLASADGKGRAAPRDVGRRGPSHARHVRYRAAAARRRRPASHPADRKFIIVHGDGIGTEHLFSGEKLSTLLAVYKYKGFDQALR